MALTAKERLIVALDVADSASALKLVDLLKDEVGCFKVGLQLFTAVGPKIVHDIVALGGKVFLDLKFHDIPNTVMEAGLSAVKTGAWMFNVHAAGGLKMMQQTKEASLKLAAELGIEPPIVLAVTVLTSMDQAVLQNEVRVAYKVEEQVVHWAELAKKAGLDGVVASSQEVGALRRACGSDFLLVTPGIRPLWAAKNDQSRIMTPGDAVKAGSDYIVVGRPITAASSPKEAAKKIVKEMEGKE